MELRFVLKQIDIHTKHWQTRRKNKHVNFHQDSLWNTFLTILHPQILRCRNLLCVSWRILPPEAGRRFLLACSPSGSPAEYLHKVEKNGKGEHHKNNLRLLETLRWWFIILFRLQQADLKRKWCINLHLRPTSFLQQWSSNGTGHILLA